MNKVIVLAALLLTTVTGMAKNDKPLYKDPKAPIEARINDLIGRMTLEEKVMQLNEYTVGLNFNPNNMADPVAEVSPMLGSVIYSSANARLRNQIQRKVMRESRLGIPMLFGWDVIHGFQTIYPIGLAQGCSFNPDLVRQTAHMAALEGKAAGIDWFFSPMIDVAHDPRWGRISEGYGEDPYLTARMAEAVVHGFQGDELGPTTVAACPKHFVGYGASEAGRDYVYTEISGTTLWNMYLPPYEAAVKAGAMTVMSSFNDISGTPATAHHYLLTDVLKEQWGMKGFVISDWDGVKQLVNQGYAEDRKDCAAKAINAGLDIDMNSGCYQDHLAELVSEGRVDTARVNDAVRRVLRLKFILGLFENPYTQERPDKQNFLLPAYRQQAEQLAEETMVLLKNQDNTLPLKAKKIAVVGPLAKNSEALIGNWRAMGRDEDAVQLWEGLQQEFQGTAELRFVQGCSIDKAINGGLDSVRSAASWADAIVLCMGEQGNWSGENQSRANITLPEAQTDLIAALRQSGKPLVLVLANGRPLDLHEVEPQVGAILEIWQPGVNGAQSMAGILSGRINPSGKLDVTFPYSGAQIPIYYNRHPAARFADQGFYHDMTVEPLYPFGHGLSYTHFTYSNLRTSQTTFTQGDSVTVSVDVTNDGGRDGKEAVLWYVTDPVSSVTRPMKELRYFSKELIPSGETHTFTFHIQPQRDLAYRDGKGNLLLEPGKFIIQVGDKQLTLLMK